MLKKLCLDIKNELTHSVIILAANTDGKAAVALSVSDDIGSTKNIEANKMIKEIVSPLINGGGGGQKNLATAGGQDVSKLHEVIACVKKYIQTLY